MNKVVVITGANSGIGLACAKAFLEQGDIAYCLARHSPSDNNIKYQYCDVTNRDHIKHALEEIHKAEGHIDIVVNNAGMGISGATEYEPVEDIQKIIDINLVGVINVCSLALPYLRQTKGRIINIGSLASIFPIPFQSLYSTTKAGVLSFSMALQNEIRPSGILVSCVLPGDVKTNFTANREKTEIKDDPVYGDRVRKSISKMEHDEQNGMPASKVAKVVLKCANKRRPPVVVSVGWQYKLFRGLTRIVPTRLMQWILHQMYSK